MLNIEQVKSNYCLFLVFLILPIFSFAQNKENKPSSSTVNKKSVLSLMRYQPVIPVTVEGNIINLMEDKLNRRLRPGSFSFPDSLGNRITLPARFETRGKTRLIRCDITPMGIYFDKKGLEEQKIKNYPKLKAVFPCFDTVSAEDLLFREMLVYKLYEVVSDYHFKVQVAEFIALDSINQDTTHTYPAFFIESDKELKKRLDLEELDQFNIQWDDLDPKEAQISAFFQYMISNADWRIDHKHNLKFFRKNETSPLILVPYDFDFSGLVNADYAKPNPNYDQETVRHRIYIGKKNKFVNEVIQHYLDKEAEIIKTVDDYPYLSAESKMDIKEFLAIFFIEIKNKKAIRKIFKDGFSSIPD